MLFCLLLVVSSLLLTADAAAELSTRTNAPLIKYDMDVARMPNSYKYHYDASDGSSRTEEGGLVTNDDSPPALDVRGAVRWYDDKGHLYEMTYKAGRRGYRTIIKKIS